MSDSIQAIQMRKWRRKKGRILLVSFCRIALSSSPVIQELGNGKLCRKPKLSLVLRGSFKESQVLAKWEVGLWCLQIPSEGEAGQGQHCCSNCRTALVPLASQNKPHSKVYVPHDGQKFGFTVKCKIYTNQASTFTPKIMSWVSRINLY